MNSEELTQNPELVEQQTAPEATDPQTASMPLMMTKEEVLARAAQLVESGETSDKQELELLKQLYYRYRHAEVAEQRQAYIEAGGNADDFVPEPDESEIQFKEAMHTIRERRALAQAALEKEREENLTRKLAVIEKIKVLATTPEEANKSYEDFKALQAEWKETGPVPAEHMTEVWKNYQLYVEQFYDMLKLNSEMREYDFRKNLEAKLTLCTMAEKLAEENDIIAAINKLQTLHQEWKEIGPVAKDIREQVWNRFKDASTVIRKRHQDHFEARKAAEDANLIRKTELCERAEAIEIEGLSTFAAWDAKTQEILALQAEWKTVGFAPQKSNGQVFERFRAACDKFFAQKATFFREMKSSLNENLKRKTALAEKAEELSTSTEWKKTTDAIVEMQKEWRTIGAVPRKVSDQVWKRFTTACDKFFEAKSAAHADQRAEQTQNLAKKRDIIAQLKELLEADEQTGRRADERTSKLKELQAEWNETGHVPMREKDKVYAQYREVVDALYKQLNLSQAQRRLSSFRTALRVTGDQGGNSLTRERDKLMRTYEMMKNEIQTYENNLGFLTASSKKGNSLVQDVMRKIEKLKGELDLLGQKIKAVNDEIRKAEKG